MPKPDNKEYDLPPRKRTIPSGLEPREPTVLTLDDAERIFR